MAPGWRTKVVVLLHAVNGVVSGASLSPTLNVPQQIRMARASLQAGQVDLAMRQAFVARAADPTDPAVLSLLGDVAYRKSHFEAAGTFYRAAVAADPTCARALWGVGRIEELNFRRGSARDYYAAAFRLDPRDPAIIRSYNSVVRDRDAQILLLKNYVAAGGEGPEHLQSAIGRIQLLERLRTLDMDVLASPYRSYTLPMTPYYVGSARQAGMLLKVSLNGGTPLRLIFDTGARGVLIRSKSAEKLGLQFLGSALVRGPSAGASANARIALAQSLTIDDLRLHDCLIEVSDALPAGDADGVIGAKIFERFLIHFKAAGKLLTLTPFPNLDARDLNLEATWHGRDRIAVSGTNQSIMALQVGHLLLVRSLPSKDRPRYFILDTGAAFSSVSFENGGWQEDAALPAPPIYGLSGRIDGATRVRTIQFNLGGKPMIDRDAIAFDLREVSRREGVEISGLIGYPMLSRSVLKIDYRDGLIDIVDQR